MDWKLDKSRPICPQLCEKLNVAIASGELLPGDRMQTVREMALEAGVNPNTMQRALQQLEREGLVYTQRSSGRFVTEDTAVIQAARRALAKEHVERFRASMKSLGYTGEEMKMLLEGSGEEDDNGKLS